MKRITKKMLFHQVKESVNSLEPQAEITLFGSRARGNHRPESDWNFLILMPDNLTLPLKRKIKDSLYEVELLSGQQLSTLILDKTDWEKNYYITEIFENINKEGIKI